MTYDSTEGKIWIAIESNPGTEVTQSDTSTLRQRAGESLAEGWCKTLINKLRVELATGYPDHPPRWLRYFVHGYGHSAFANLPNPPELVQLNKILPKLFLLRAHAADDSVSIICTGPLIGSEISIEREPLRIVE
jgi:hypothetical protein